MKKIKKKLALAFKMVDINTLAFYVNLKVTRDWKKKTIKLSQPGNINRLFNWHEILKAKTTKTQNAKNIFTTIWKAGFL